MFGSISNSFSLMGESFRVLRADKELVVFPIVSGVVSLLVFASFAAGIYGTGLYEAFLDESAQVAAEEGQITADHIVGGIVTFLYYLVSYFVIIYFNAGLVGAAHIRLTGGDPTVADGFRAANRVLPAIFGWAMVAATVGLILKVLESNNRNPIARIVIGLVGMAWSLLTFLVVPVIVIEGVGPFTAVKRSSSLFRSTWGEQVMSNIGFGLLSFVLVLPGLALAGFGVFQMTSAGAAVLGGMLIGIGVLWVLLVGIVLAACQGIFTAALYAHAADEPLQYFSRDMVTGAFIRR